MSCNALPTEMMAYSHEHLLEMTMACHPLPRRGPFPTMLARQYQIARPIDFAYPSHPSDLYQTTFSFSSLPQHLTCHYLQTICSRRLSTFVYRARAMICIRYQHVLFQAHQKHRRSDRFQIFQFRSLPYPTYSLLLAEFPA